MTKKPVERIEDILKNLPKEVLEELSKGKEKGEDDDK